MNELSLFTGAGGGVLGTHHLLGWKTCGYVEWNEYCQRVIAARIADGYLTSAPIFTDVREFVQSGAAEQYRGVADVVSAGFPCQPFSVSGKQEGEDDPRNMWPATAEVIRIVQPESVELENVPGLVSCGYIYTVLADLAAMGYVGRWGILGAVHTGAKHKRERLWIAAHANRDRLQKRMHVAGPGGETTECQQQRRASDRISASANDPNAYGGERSLGWTAGRAGVLGECISRNRDWSFTTEPVLDRGADGVAHRLDRLKALGNGQVPAVVERAWRELAA